MEGSAGVAGSGVVRRIDRAAVHKICSGQVRGAVNSFPHGARTRAFAPPPGSSVRTYYW
jgi:hypothetical protein